MTCWVKENACFRDLDKLKPVNSIQRGGIEHMRTIRLSGENTLSSLSLEEDEPERRRDGERAVFETARKVP